MRKIIYVLSFVLLMCSACGRQQGSIRDAALLNHAEEAYKAGAYEETITDSSEAIKLSPTDRVYFLRVMAHLAKGDETKAFSDLNDSLNLNPNQADVLAQRADLYRRLQQYDKAIADLTKAIQLDPTHISSAAYVQRGEAYTFKQAFSQALADFNQALQQDRNNADAYLGRADLFRMQGAYEKAISDYNQALQSKPEVERAYAGRGDAYFFSAQYNKAMNDYDKALSLSSDQAELALLSTGRADALFMQGMYEAAITEYTKAIALNPRLAEAYAGRGDTFSTLNQLDKAGVDFNAAIKLVPTRAQTYVNRGDLYFLRGKYTAAIEDYTTALKLGIANESRRRQVEQQRADVQAELQKNPTEENSSLSMCTWFARAQFIRTARLEQAGNFGVWQQTYGAHALTAFDNVGFKAWIDILRNYQPSQKQFIKQWTSLVPPLAGKSFWEEELNAVQQQLIAADQMLVSYDTHDIHQFEKGLALWQAALQSAQASEQAMQPIHAQCLH